MRTILLMFLLGSISAFGQDDAGAMAAQQAMQQAIQINQQASQQAMQDMQQASQLASQQAMQAMQNAQQYSGPVIALTAQPKFSVPAGPVTAGTTVRLKCSTHYAVIYYTTNGWTPTTASRRYKGPIPINATTHLQAIAVAPKSARSLIARADYVVQGPAALVQPLALSMDGILHAGTRLHLVTNSTVNSKTAQVGDPISLLLDQEIKVGEAVVAPKGTPIDATITMADPAGHAGVPGEVTFEVDALTVHGTKISLSGGETLEGADHYKMRNYVLIPVVGAASLLVKGDEAEIKPGMTFTAAVATDATLNP